MHHALAATTSDSVAADDGGRNLGRQNATPYRPRPAQWPSRVVRSATHRVRQAKTDKAGCRCRHIGRVARMIHDFVRRDSNPVELRRRGRSPVVQCVFSPLDGNPSLTRVVSKHASRVNNPGWHHQPRGVRCQRPKNKIYHCRSAENQSSRPRRSLIHVGQNLRCHFD